uniref:Putative secreted protein n=1 Tax=Anopheles triannulatus TaxID=58253 RepID=A0A2M4B6H0_9DIPT
MWMSDKLPPLAGASIVNLFLFLGWRSKGFKDKICCPPVCYGLLVNPFPKIPPMAVPCGRTEFALFGHYQVRACSPCR